MRQVVGLIAVIDKAKLVQFYSDTLSYATVHGTKLPSLEDFLGVSSDKQVTAFDAVTDANLEAFAQKKLKERQEKHGKSA